MDSTDKTAKSKNVIILFLILIGSTMVSANPTENLYYNMSNGFQDLSGNNYDGTGFNGITSGDALGIYGDATSFDGNDKYVDVPSISALSSDDGNFSISFWIKSSDWSGFGWIFDGQETHAITVNTESTNNIAFAVTEKGASNNFAKYSGLQDNTWYHVVAVKSTNKGMELYLNNSLEATNSGATFTDYKDKSYSNNIGRDSSSDVSERYFEGTVDEFKIFDEALTSSQVNELYTVTEPNTEPSLSNPSPADGQTNVSTDTSLSIDFADLDGDSGRVEFYNASDNSLIGNVTGVSNGGKAVTSDLSLDQEATVEWYAKAFDGNNGVSETSNFSFTTTSEQVSGSSGSDCFAGWRFNETSGPALDYCGSNNGDWNGGISSVEGVSSSYAFDGLAYDFSNDGYVNIPDDMAFADGSSSFTLSAWIYPTDINEFGWILDLQSDYSITLNSENTDNIAFNTKFESDNCKATYSGLSNNEWYHLVGVYNSSSGCELIVNNMSRDSVGKTGTLFTGLSNNWIAGDSSSPGDSSRYFDGRIDDPKIFDEALNSSEISNLYNYGITNSSNAELTSADPPNGSLNLPADGESVDPLNSYNGTFTWYGNSSKVELWMNKTTPYSFELSQFTNRTLDSESTRWLGRASVAEADDGDWYMVYRNAEGHGPADADALVLRCSSDQGDTWSDRNTDCDGSSFTLFPYDSGVSEADPDIFTAPNGTMQINIHRDVDAPRYLMSNDNGSTWSDEGVPSFSSTGGYSTSDIQLGQDHVVVGDTVWITAWIFEPSHKAVLFKSDNNGYTYDFVTTVGGETTDESDEIGIEYLGDSNFLTVMRDRSRDKTYQRIVYDNGSSLGSFNDITSQLNGDIVQRPRLVKFSDGSIRMTGRDYREYSNQSIGLWTTYNGSQWSEYNLDEFSDNDSAYGDLMEREGKDDNTYLATYKGPGRDSASIIDYRFRMQPTGYVSDWESVASKNENLVNNSLINIEIDAESLGFKLGEWYEWSLRAYDSVGQSSFADTNRTVFIQSVEDNAQPSIIIESPQNQTYSFSSVGLNVVSSESATFNYNVDGSSNITVSDTGTDLNETLSGLSDGGHTVNVYATDSNGNTGSASTSFTVDSGPPKVYFNMDNIQHEAWNISNESEPVATESGGNPNVNLEQGKRYVIQNDGYSAHPLGFLSSNGSVLLSQSSAGSFEDKSGVNWVDNGDVIKFTVTQGLYDELYKYRCNVHYTKMYGSINGNSDPTASFSTSTTDLNVDVDASGSSDSDGSIAKVQWDWTNDGTYDATGSTSSHTYPSDGTYNINLRVTDNFGTQSTTTETVSVSSSSDGGGGGGGGGGTTDTTPPTSSDNWDVSGSLDKEQAAVQLSATDTGVGVDRIEYQVNGNGFKSVSGNSAEAFLTTEGNNTLEYYAVDNNGNQEQTNTEYVAFSTGNNDNDDSDSGGDTGDGTDPGTVSLSLGQPSGDISKDGQTEITQVFNVNADVNNTGTLQLQVKLGNDTSFTGVDGKVLSPDSSDTQQFTETFKVNYSNATDKQQVSEQISYRLEWQGDNGYSLASSVQKFRYINNIDGSGNNATGLFSGIPSGLGVYLLLVLLLGVLALPLLIKVRLNND